MKRSRARPISPFLWRVAAVAALVALAGCAAPRVAPSADRLAPGRLEVISAESRGGPLTLEQITRRSKAGEAPVALIEDIRRTGTHLAVPPDERARLIGQGVAPAVLDELAAAQARWAQDQATAERVRIDTARIEAADRARAEEERRRRAYYGPVYSPYYNPMLPYGYPAYRGYGGASFGWGVQIRR